MDVTANGSPASVRLDDESRTGSAPPPGILAGGPVIRLVGDDVAVPCYDGSARRYVNLDNAASTSAFESVRRAVAEFLPFYSSVHRGAGYKSRYATAAYESARSSALGLCRPRDPDSVAILCRNTTEALNHLAYRLRFAPDDVVLTTVVEHHANLLPWARVARRRYVECGRDGIFTVDAVLAGLAAPPRPRLLAVTGASNVTGFLPPLGEIIEAAHEHGVPVLVDAAQLAPHRPIPAGADYVAFSGHKLYAPFGIGALVGPRSAFTDGDPFLAGGGAVDLVDLDEVTWSEPPEREEAGSPNVVGAVALDAALGELHRIGWDRITSHEQRLARRLRAGLAATPGVRLLGPPLDEETLAIGTFLVEGVHHALVAARLSAEWGIGVRHGCFCAHPYLIRLLGLSEVEVGAYRARVRRGDHRSTPGAVRASCSLATSDADVDALLDAVTVIAADGAPGSRSRPPVRYRQDRLTGDFWPVTGAADFLASARPASASCARG
jgi:selenocysteine lyase/cysteine desulfurase